MELIISHLLKFLRPKNQVMKKSATSGTLGMQAEVLARDYLTEQGLQWLESNYRCYWGEIDLIMRDADCLVFIEVRARSSITYGGAVASITYQKQERLGKAATHYLLAHKKLANYPSRFDVLSVQGISQQVDWIKNAFSINF